MRCFRCGNDIDNNLECPFCGYINKEEKKKGIQNNDSKIEKFNNDQKREKYIKDRDGNKIIDIIGKIFSYMQVVFSIMMALICFALEKPFFPFISWIFVALAFIPKIKQIMIKKVYKIKKWVIPIRIILIIFAMIVFFS